METINKITLEQLAVFLPYGLKGNLINPEYYEDVVGGELFRIETGITTQGRVDEPIVIVGDYEDNISKFTPYVRPMSDLKSFVMIDGQIREAKEALCEHIGVEPNGPAELCIAEFYMSLSDLYFTKDYTDNLRFEQIMKGMFWLFKHHFDVFNWIPQGLAVNLNDIEK